MKFDYSKFPLSVKSSIFGTALLKPIIPVKVCYKDVSITYTALIDSGADFCIFDAEIGEFLGLVVKNGDEINFGGVQEACAAKAYMHDVFLNVGGHDYKTKVGFSYDIAKHGYGLLGQHGFFDIFTVKFDLAKEEIELKDRINHK